MENESSRGNVFFNPYSSRSRPSSRGRVRSETQQTPERVRDVFDDDRQDTVRISTKTVQRENSNQKLVPSIITDDKQRRAGFFSNLKNLVESKQLKLSLSRGINTSTGLSQSRPGSIN